MDATQQAQKLAKIIEDNRGQCTAVIDNDAWHIYRDQPAGFDDWSFEETDAWYDASGTLAQWSDYPLLGNSYGNGILEALALKAELKLEDV